MNVTTAPRFPLSNDWADLSFKETAEKITELLAAQNVGVYLSRQERKKLCYSIQQAAKSGEKVELTFRGEKPELLNRNTMNRTSHADPTARTAIRLVNATPRTREQILFELGEGAA